MMELKKLDVDDVATIHKLIDLFTLVDDEFVPKLSERMLLDRYVAWLMARGDFYYVEEHNTIIVTTIVQTIHEFPAIEGVIVHPDYRGKGIGKLFVQQIFDILKEQECKQVTVHTWSTNYGAIEFYKKLGFTLEGYFEDRARPEGVQTAFLKKIL